MSEDEDKSKLGKVLKLIKGEGEGGEGKKGASALGKDIAEVLRDPILSAQLELTIWNRNASYNIADVYGPVTAMSVPITILLRHAVVYAQQTANTPEELDELVDEYKKLIDDMKNEKFDVETI